MGGMCSSEAKVAKRDGNKEINEVVHFPESPNTSVRATRGKDSEEERIDDEDVGSFTTEPKPTFTISGAPRGVVINPLAMRVRSERERDISFKGVSNETSATLAQDMEQVIQAWSMNTRRDSFVRDLDDSAATEHGEIDDAEATQHTLKRTSNFSKERSFATQRAAQRAEEVRLHKALAMNTSHTALPNVPDDPALADVMSAMGAAYRPSSASFSSRHK